MLKLETPSERWCAEFSDMAEDFRRHGDSRYARSAQDFEGFLRGVQAEESSVQPAGRVPGSQFWLMSEGRILGCSRLRHRLTAELEHEGGHIGYDVRPSDRGQGVGTALLRLTLEKAAAMGITRVRITCDADNQPSIRVVEKNGGALDAVVTSRTRGVRICQFWVLVSR